MFCWSTLFFKLCAHFQYALCLHDQRSSTLVLGAYCPAYFRCFPAHTWFKWMGRYQALQKPNNDPFIWIRCDGAGDFNQTGQRGSEDQGWRTDLNNGWDLHVQHWYCSHITKCSTKDVLLPCTWKSTFCIKTGLRVVICFNLLFS